MLKRLLHPFEWFPLCRICKCRCVAGTGSQETEAAWFANLIWACSKWQHSLEAAALAPLVAAAVSNVSADWQKKGRLGGLRLLKALAQQVGGSGQVRLAAGVLPCVVRVAVSQRQPAAVLIA